MITLYLQAYPLTRAAFAPFGDVIETDGANHFSINSGTVERYHDLARVDVGSEYAGRPIISLAVCNQTTRLPYRVELVERHPLGSQAFIPVSATPIYVVVAPPGDWVNPYSLHAFVSNGHQGINYHRGVWHMPLICQEPAQRFIVVDRAGPEENCEEWRFDGFDVLLRA